jgi:hypothetical protein
VLSALPDRQFAAVLDIMQPTMRELLQNIDIDYYRSAQLLIVHAELERLRQEPPASADVKRRGCPRNDNESADVSSVTRRTALPAE